MSDRSETSSGVVYGRHVVLSALQDYPDRVEHIWILKSARLPGRLLKMLRSVRKQGLPVTYVDRIVLDRLTGKGSHQGIAARVSHIRYETLDRWWQEYGAGREELLIVVLDRIQDPRNIGAIFRTAAAAEVDVILVPYRRGSPLTAVADKASAGTLDKTPVVRVGNLAQAVRFLKEKDIVIIGITEKTNRILFEEPFPPRVALILGSEGRGIRPGLLKICDQTRRIPLTGPAGSLNVASAAAITLYEFTRSKMTRMEEVSGQSENFS